MKLTLELDARRGRRVVRGAALIALASGLAYPAWLAASQVTGLITFQPGDPIRAADFNHNFSTIEAAVDDTDSHLTTLTSQVGSLPGTVTTLQGDVSTLQGNVSALQGQVSSLQSQNASLLAQLAALQAVSVVGIPDTSFGTKGVAAGGPANATPTCGAIDASGRILAGGTDDTTRLAYVAAFHASGSLDTTFGTQGIVEVNTANANGYGMRLDSRGRIVLVGSSTPSGGKLSATVWRLLSNGTLDASFATGGTFVIPSTGFDAAQAVAFDSSGNLLIAGESLTTASVATIWRVTPSGTLDTTYGTSGLAVLSSPLGVSATGIAIDSSDRAAVVVNSIHGFDVARFDSTGQPDTAFNTTGNYVSPLGVYTSGTAYNLTIDPSGRYVVVGYYSNGTTVFMTAVRVTATGATDTTFGTGGVYTSPSAGRAYAAIVDTASRIVLVGVTGGPAFDLALWRLTTTGALDPTFAGGAGMVDDTAAPNQISLLSLDLDSSGRIVVASGENASGAAAVYRFK